MLWKYAGILCSVENIYSWSSRGVTQVKIFKLSDRYVVNIAGPFLCAAFETLRKNFSFDKMIRHLIFVTLLCVKIARAVYYQWNDLKYGAQKFLEVVTSVVQKPAKELALFDKFGKKEFSEESETNTNANFFEIFLWYITLVPIKTVVFFINSKSLRRSLGGSSVNLSGGLKRIVSV